MHAADEPPRDLRAARQLTGGASEAQRAPAARSAHQRCSVPRSSRKRPAAQRDQRTRVAAADDLRVGDATACRGSTAAQAEFRTASGTWPRVGGLLLILAGALGLLLLLGFIAVRLLTAALFSLLFLLLTPGVVLAPAFGETGRAVFRRWATQLLSAVVSKLLFSFLLGAVLAVGAILEGLTALGWWTSGC